MRAEFPGNKSILPHEFMRLIVGIKNPLDVEAYTVLFSIKVLIKVRSLLTRSGWDYYQWVDSFLESFRESVSQEDYFKRINWDSALTILNIIECQQGKKK
jgi:hypothetical protein